MEFGLVRKHVLEVVRHLADDRRRFWVEALERCLAVAEEVKRSP